MKFVFWFYLFTQFGLSYIFAGIEKFYYRLPDENGFSLVGRKALIRNTDSLDLYEYVNRSKCNENDNDIKYLKVAKINCAKITKVTDLESKEQNTNQDPGIFPAVVMNDGTVVYLDYETNGLSYTDRKYIKWNIVSWKDGVTKIVKEYKVFDLGKFAEDYQQGKVKFDESIKEQTGVIWSENFKVIDQNTIGFLDLMIVTVDNEKPTEAIVRERQLNIFTGEETMREREREP